VECDAELVRDPRQVLDIGVALAVRYGADPGPLAGGPVRHVQAAVLRGQRAPGALALLEVVRELAPPGA
jgi:hypothetical protein